MPKIAAGVQKFRRETYPTRQALFERLAAGQEPEALFITCADSRVDPAMLTSSEPGEIFVLRNAGNIVPPHGDRISSMSASIEFAVAALKVPHIVVCGHTECGAMAGARDLASLDALPQVRRWLNYSKAAVDGARARMARSGGAPDLSGAEGMRLLLRENVLLQLRHLRTHPTVAAALAAGTVTLHGWVYDIRTGEVEAHDETTGAFTPVEERYREAIAALASHEH